MAQVNPQRVRDGKIIYCIADMVHKAKQHIAISGRVAQVVKIIVTSEDLQEIMASPPEELCNHATIVHGKLETLFHIPVEINDLEGLTVQIACGTPSEIYLREALD